MNLTLFFSQNAIGAITNPYSEFLRTYQNETVDYNDPIICLSNQKAYKSEYGEAISNLIKGVCIYSFKN